MCIQCIPLDSKVRKRASVRLFCLYSEHNTGQVMGFSTWSIFRMFQITIQLPLNEFDNIGKWGRGKGKEKTVLLVQGTFYHFPWFIQQTFCIFTVYESLGCVPWRVKTGIDRKRDLGRITVLYGDVICAEGKTWVRRSERPEPGQQSVWHASLSPIWILPIAARRCWIVWMLCWNLEVSSLLVREESSMDPLPP